MELGVGNTQAVGWINKGSARPAAAMPFIKELFWLGIQFEFKLEVIYLPGVHNSLSDCASRLKLGELQQHLDSWCKQHRKLWI